LLELISILEPGTSGTLADMQTKKARTAKQISLSARLRSVACRGCKGWPKKFKIHCPLCCGSGKRAVARCVGDRSRIAPGVDAASVCYLISGMRPEAWAAAETFVTGCPLAQKRLEEALLLSRFSRSAERWRNIDEARREEMKRKLCNLAAFEFCTPGLVHKEANRYRKGQVGKTVWHQTWKGRFLETYDVMHEWLDQAERHMIQRARGRKT